MCEAPAAPSELAPLPSVPVRPARRRTAAELAQELDDLSCLLREALADRSLATGGLSLPILRELRAMLELTVKTQLSTNQVCGQRTVTATVSRVKGYGSYTLSVSVP